MCQDSPRKDVRTSHSSSTTKLHKVNSTKQTKTPKLNIRSSNQQPQPSSTPASERSSESESEEAFSTPLPTAVSSTTLAKDATSSVLSKEKGSRKKSTSSQGSQDRDILSTSPTNSFSVYSASPSFVVDGVQEEIQRALERLAEGDLESLERERRRKRSSGTTCMVFISNWTVSLPQLTRRSHQASKLRVGKRNQESRQ